MSTKKPFAALVGTTTGGTERTQIAKYKTFSETIEGERFWFAVHTDMANPYMLVLSHIDSGMRVSPIGRRTSIKRGWTVAGRECLQALVQKHGAAHVARIIRAEMPQAPAASEETSKKPGQKRAGTRKVWAVSYVPGNPEVTRMGVYTDAGGPYLRQGALDTAQSILSHNPRWRLWVHHTQTGEHIFESESEKLFQARQEAS